MKASSCPNLNRETTSFPNFFTFFEHPDHHNGTTLNKRPKIPHGDDTTLNNSQKTNDTEPSETSPFKGIHSTSLSVNETNENHYRIVGFFPAWPPSPNGSDPSISVGSNEDIITSGSVATQKLWNIEVHPMENLSTRWWGLYRARRATMIGPNFVLHGGDRRCQYFGCSRAARGASGLCISHGGGPRCQKPYCQKGAVGGTVYCKAHGGGRRCEELGCTKSAEGRTDKCIAHGGERRCSHEGCGRAARGKTGLCIKHGGGKRCQKENCTKSARGLSGLCIWHGGGWRCQHLGCTKGAHGYSSMFCKAHGGDKRCKFEGGCTKGAEGSTPFCKGHGGRKRCSFAGGGVCPKSVHGAFQFCVAHGGGKRCAIPECTKSARGRTDFCVRHGGGKRCQSEGCGKSAQGATDFCKAHGGGKRCSWGQLESEFGKGESPCYLFARGQNGLCTAHAALVHDTGVYWVATLGPMHGP